MNSQTKATSTGELEYTLYNSRHLLSLLTAIVIGNIIWCVGWLDNYSLLKGAALAKEIAVDLFQGTVEITFLFEISLLATKAIIRLFSNIPKTYFTLLLQCLVLLIFVCALSYGASIAYKMAYPDIKELPQVVFVSDALLTYFLTSLFLISFLYKRLRVEELENSRLSIDAERSRRQFAEARINCLTLKTDNHFVFNSLAVLDSLILTEPQKASEFNLALARMYRHIVSNGDKTLVPIPEEISFIEDYVSNLRIRNNSIDLTIANVIKERGDILLPPLTLHSLINNAISHNRFSEQFPLNISLYMERDYIVVENNIQVPEKKFRSTGTGLDTLIERYSYLGCRKAEVVKDDGKFKVMLPIINERIS